ncbi:MAG TPA: ribonuclease J [Candidatus Gemmiger faecigallinarum]|nr:ribonuclease J [Candidatus Gemmiger faecigallinarum]
MEDFNDKRQPARSKTPRAPRGAAPRRPRRTPAPKPQETAAAVETVEQPSRPQRPARAPRPRRAANPAAPAAPAAQQVQPFQQAPRPRRRSMSRAPRVEEQPAVSMHVCPLGGLGEVGKNITLYECQGDMILVDCGSVFPDSDMFGIDLVIPDFSYVLENKDRIKGLFITHGHEDHIGSLPYLLRQFNVPIYATRLTIGLMRNKLEEHGLAASARFNEIRPRQKVRLGCFTVEPIHVNHSIPDAVAFAIECPAGVVIHTGDFKIDYTPLSGDAVTDLSTIAEYGRRGVLALLADSTNAERPGFTATEQTVAEGVRGLFARARNKRIIVATFASNIYRVQQIIELAIESGRKVAVNGRSMVSNTEMAKELGYLHVPDNVLIDIEEVNKYPPEKVVLITTGSQGEPLSALSRMAQASHRNVKVGPGDFIIISARPIPGNEKTVTKVVNGLLALGAEVIYENMYDTHVSGHACQEEQKLILTLAHPQYFLPVHGEFKQLKRHAETAEHLGYIPKQNIYIAENGQNIRLSRDGMVLEGTVPAGAVMVDGYGVGDVGNVVLRDRHHLSEDGIIVVTVTIDGRSGRVLAGPELVSRGFVYVRESEELIDGARTQVEIALDRALADNAHDWNSLKTRVREALSSYIYRKTKRSPMILPILMEV